MKLKVLLEELLTFVKAYTENRTSHVFPIYLLTPQHYEEDLARAIHGSNDARFLADPVNKEVYVFSDQVLHQYVVDKLQIGQHNNVIRGYFFEKNGKYWTNNLNAQRKTWITKYIGFTHSYD